jgi:hypothetical protein
MAGTTTGSISQVRDNRIVDKLVRDNMLETTIGSIDLSSKQQECGNWTLDKLVRDVYGGNQFKFHISGKRQ